MPRRQKWSKIDNTTKRMKCEGCGNQLLFVIVEPVQRQEKTMGAHHKRIAAECPVCQHKQRIALGGPS